MKKHDSNRGNVLYIGGFLLPDKNAAAGRVINIGKIFRLIGYKVIYLGASEEAKLDVELENSFKVQQFECYNVLATGGFSALSRATELGFLYKALEKYPDTSIIVVYNYSAIALAKIIHIAKKKNIKVVSDCTEWYSAKLEKNILKKAFRWFDTSYRMRIIHFKTDGIIAISSYLYDYYSTRIPTVIIPPTVDFTDEVWQINENKKSEKPCINLVYAGSPSSVKERLDIVVETISKPEFIDKIKLDVVGISKEKYCDIYRTIETGKNVVFHGRLSHNQTVEIIKQSTYSLIIRENNRTVQAGFPTKFVECITCGTPALATKCSDLENYISDGKNGKFVDLEDFQEEVFTVVSEKIPSVPKRDIFDYHNYVEQLKKLMYMMGVYNE